MKLSIGFITYKDNTLKYLSYFLESLDQALSFLNKEDYEILCWDNTDNGDPNNRLAIEQYNYEYSQSIKYYTEEKNLGFSKAYNKLISQAADNKSEYFLVINPDTIIEKNSIELLVKALEKNSSLASVSPKVLSWNFLKQKKTNIIDTCGIALKPGLLFYDLGQTEVDQGQYDHHSILGPSGAAALFRIEFLQKIQKNGQYFDENFFMYKEDCDLVYRLFLQGYKSKLIPEALVYHDRTIKIKGRGYWERLKYRKTQSKKLRSLSFLNQHLLFFKYWHKQTFKSKLIIIIRLISLFILALFFERFLLKEYSQLYKIIKKR